MSHEFLAVRISGNNPNHNLWDNNGTKFLHFTAHPTIATKKRYRVSLKTKAWGVARKRRDQIFRGLRRGLPLDEVYRTAVRLNGTEPQNN